MRFRELVPSGENADGAAAEPEPRPQPAVGATAEPNVMQAVATTKSGPQCQPALSLEPAADAEGPLSPTEPNVTKEEEVVATKRGPQPAAPAADAQGKSEEGAVHPWDVMGGARLIGDAEDAKRLAAARRAGRRHALSPAMQWQCGKSKALQRTSSSNWQADLASKNRGRLKKGVTTVAALNAFSAAGAVRSTDSKDSSAAGSAGACAVAADEKEEVRAGEAAKPGEAAPDEPADLASRKPVDAAHARLQLSHVRRRLQLEPEPKPGDSRAVFSPRGDAPRSA